MKLSAIIEQIKPLAVSSRADHDIKGLAYDSRQVRPGYIFFALKGQRQNGAFFVQDAVERGAVCVVTEETRLVGKGPGVVIQVAGARQAMAEAARVFYGDPSARLKLVGITGTNGKTTTAFMIKSIFEATGIKSGMIGTIEYIIGQRAIPATRTTPESIDIAQMLDAMLSAGCASAVMEVSSHALVQKRVWGLEFDAAVFTNLSHDHLDYHKTMDRYFDAKAILFKKAAHGNKKTAAIVNLDDPYGSQLARMQEMKALQLVTYGCGGQAAVRADNLRLSAEGSAFDVSSPWGAATINLRLKGRYNVSNALAAFATGGALGIAPDLLAATLMEMTFVPGRLEEIPTNAGFQVFVDYAHTEDALRNVLNTLREIASGRLIVVFGCGGNRDTRKRSLMGSAAEELADYAIVTSDNPRREEPDAFIAQILSGFKSREKVEAIPDRYEAIARALSIASKGDVVLIAGKGHENYQEFANTILPFDDREVVRECLGLPHAKA